MAQCTSLLRRGTALALVAMLALASRGNATPVELKDQNGTKYQINTEVPASVDNSNASGALTDATYVKGVTVTDYFIGFTPFGFFLTTYTTMHKVDVPLRPAFAGFNGFTITGINGTALPAALVYNPGQALAGQDCLENNVNQELEFQAQTFQSAGLTLSRKVYVASGSDFVRWLNVVTNNDSTARTIGITLQGVLGSGANTKIGTTSNDDAALTTGDLWFTSGQSLPQNAPQTQPTVAFIVEGSGATAPAVAENINVAGGLTTPPGQAIVTYTPTIPAGGSVIIMTMASVQGNFKQAKNAATNLVVLPSSTLKCMSEVELSQVVNFQHITPPTTKNATITLKFNKTGEDTVQWKGKVTIAAGINLQGLPVTVDVGGVTQNFLLAKNGSANDGGGNKFNLKAQLKDGVTKQGTVNFSFNLKGSFQTQLAQFGLTNADASNVPVTVPLSFTVGPTGAYFGTNQSFTYKATAGKTGTAKSSS
jgi:hypothetical protein